VRKIEERSGREEEEEEEGEEIGEVEMTPIQHWFFEQNLTHLHHWNMPGFFESRIPFDPSTLDRAVRVLLAHHDALRMRYEHTESGWRQRVSELDDEVPLTWLDLSALDEPERVRAMERAAALLQSSLNLIEGPVLRIAAFHLGENLSSRLLLIIHHLVVDAVSWRILLEDLQTAYEQLIAGSIPRLSRKTTSFRRWGQMLTEYAGKPDISKEIKYWTSDARKQATPIPVEFHEGANTIESTRDIMVSLSSERTQLLLHEVQEAYRTQISDLLLTALALAYESMTGERTVLVDLEGHGREDIFDKVDITRTVGWFTTRFPVLLDLTYSNEPGGALVSVKEQLRRIPKRGIGYGVLRYLSSNSQVAEQLKQMPQPEISFNYFGRLDRMLAASSPFAPASESFGPARYTGDKRRYLIEINAAVAGGEMQAVWTYSSEMYSQETIEAFSGAFITALDSLIDHCLSLDAGAYTPSDFSDEDLTVRDIATIFAEISEA
jgi:non-ribosomal peptide synthase protein (TIGR01720 family)